MNLGKAVNQIEFFDTAVALLAGVMIIPAVYVFSGVEGMGAGPSLMFVSLPKVFAASAVIALGYSVFYFELPLQTDRSASCWTSWTMSATPS